MVDGVGENNCTVGCSTSFISRFSGALTILEMQFTDQVWRYANEDRSGVGTPEAFEVCRR